MWVQERYVTRIETRGGRVGGGLFKPRGKRILNYYCNLGKDTNNKAEAYALLKGL
jgi:hypothetical protein